MITTAPVSPQQIPAATADVRRNNFIGIPRTVKTEAWDMQADVSTRFESVEAARAAIDAQYVDYAATRRPHATIPMSHFVEFNTPAFAIRQAADGAAFISPLVSGTFGIQLGDEPMELHRDSVKSMGLNPRVYFAMPGNDKLSIRFERQDPSLVELRGSSFVATFDEDGRAMSTPRAGADALNF